MSPIISAPPQARQNSFGSNRARGGFNLVEVVIASAIISFALISILGVMSISLVTHKDSADDTVMTLMTETALQEIANYSRNNNGAGASYAASFGAVTSSTSFTGYIYFDEYGQVTNDSGGSGTAALSYELSTTTNSAPSLKPTWTGGEPTTVNIATASLPANTVYKCTLQCTAPLSTNFPALSSSNTANSMWVVKMTFNWPANAPAANQKTRIVYASVSNHS